MIGDNIKRIRKSKNITIKQFAFLLHKNIDEIKKIENDEVKLGHEELTEIADVLNTKISIIKDNEIYIANDKTKRRIVFDLLSRSLAVILSVSATILCFIPNFSDIKIIIVFYGIAILLLSISSIPIQNKKVKINDKESDTK